MRRREIQRRLQALAELHRRMATHLCQEPGREGSRAGGAAVDPRRVVLEPWLK